MKSKIKAGLTFLSLIFAVICSLMLTACGEQKVVTFDLSAINSEVATITFDMPTYNVGDTATFRVNFTEKYSKSDCDVYANSKLIENVDGAYSYKLDTENVKIEIKNYTVNTYGYIISGNDLNVEIIPQGETVEYGETFSFTIKEREKYTEGFVVYANSVVVTDVDGVYTVENVCDDISIWFGNLSVKTFNVQTEDCEGAWIILDDVGVPTYGSDISFEVVFQEGYIKGENYKVLVNGNEIVSDNNFYVFENLTEDIVISVEGVEIQKFNMTFENCEGINIVSGAIVEYGKDYSFDFYIKDGYASYESFKVYANENLILEINDYIDSETYESGFTISNQRVTEDIVFRIEGLGRCYTIGYELSAGVGIELSKDKVVAGEDVTFTLSVLDGYDDSVFDPVVEVNGVEIYSVDDVYTISNITEDVIITVTAELFENYYMFDSVSDYITLTLEDGSTLEEVEYCVTDEIMFTVTINAGYEAMSGFMLASNTGTITKDGDVYTLTGITDNIIITAYNVAKINYTFSHNSGDFTFEVVDMKNSYQIGEYYKFSVTPNTGYTVSAVYVNGEQISSVNNVYTVIIGVTTPVTSEIIVELVESN